MRRRTGRLSFLGALWLLPVLAMTSIRGVAAPAATTTVILLDVWPDLAPGETTRDVGKMEKSGDVLRVSDVTRPQLLIFPAPGTGLHPAVMVCPGGGYSILALDLEGTEIARWLNGLGITAAVLEYRVPDKREAALGDGQRALSLLRARSQTFGIDPHRLGVLGFSAGGHLAARLSVGSPTRAYTPIDTVDRADDRPDFTLLLYPAYLLDGAGRIAPEVKPHAGMPPTFLMQTMDDSFLDAPEYASALEAVGVPARSAFYAVGGHGYGLRAPKEKPVHEWPDEAAAWLQRLMRSARH